MVNRPLSPTIDIEIDELTNSIKELATGKELKTQLVRLSKSHSKEIKKRAWFFDWHAELADEQRCVFKLVTLESPSDIQGLICVEDLGDHIQAHLMERAFYVQKLRLFSGVPGNLMAYACKLSFERGYEGFVSFVSKMDLVDHYIETLGAEILRGTKMVIRTEAARKLVDKYFDQ